MKAITPLLLSLYLLVSPAVRAAVPAIRPECFEVPSSRAADVCQEQAAAAGVRAIFYDGSTYHGKRTRVFAYYGAPADATPAKPAPGIVLIHGGGGTAFESWVKQWVDRGYAAIAMDTCGCIPIGHDPKRGRFSNAWERLPDGGPAGWGGLDTRDSSPEDNWMHQATEAVILGHSWLRSQPEVDASRIGVTGISWGGVLTCRAAGLDSRFKFAVPIYGCGFLDESSTWLGTVQQLKTQGVDWGDLYDPGRVLPSARMPILWMVGTNDFAFPPDSWRKSARTAPGTARLCMPLRMPHGHGGAGENPIEIRIFADSVVNGGEPLLKPGVPTSDQGKAQVAWEGATTVKKVELLYSRTNTGAWKDRPWEVAPATFDPAAHTASAQIPGEARFWYFHLTDERGAAVSTEYVDVPQ